MKRIISIFLALAVFVSCFAGTLTFSAEDVVSVNEMLFGIEVPDTGDYESAIIEAKNLGSNIVRISEPDDHNYTKLLKVINFARQHGMKVLLNCDHINYEFLYDKEASLAAGERLPYANAQDVDVEAVKEHYTTLINAVKGRVDYWKFGNELDNWYYKTGAQGRTYGEEYYLDVASAAAALGAASEAVKAVDANAKTLINFGWLHYGFLDGLAQNGYSWDVTGIDWYSSGSYNVENGPNGTVNQFDYGDVINHLYETFPEKEIIICETGLTPDGLDENGEITYIGDAQWLGGMIEDIKTNYSDKVSAVTAFKIYDPLPKTDENGAVIYNSEDYYGIIDANGNKKDAYYAIQSAFGGNDNWNTIKAGDVDKVYDTLYKGNAADTFGGPDIRVSDFAVTVGDRMMYRTSADGWQYRNGVANGAFTYDGTTFERFYTINPNTKNGGRGGIKYSVAANTELHIPIVVPTQALDILKYFKYEVSLDNGETWCEVTPALVETKAVKLYYDSTMTVYSVSLYNACDFRILFPPIWYDEKVTANDHVPNGTTDGVNDSPYDLLYDVNSGAVTTANGIMYMLPATAYSCALPTQFSYGCKDTITDNVVDGVHTDDDYVADLISNANIYEIDNDTVYSNIVGVLGSAPTEDSTWRWNDYGTNYGSYGERVFVPVYISGKTYTTTKPYIDYYVKAGTVVNFDIAAINVGGFQKFWDDYKIELSTDNGVVFKAVDSSNSYYTINDKSNVRTYTVSVIKDSVLRITFPDVVEMSDYIVSKDENGIYVVNSSRNYLYGNATFVSPLRSADKAILIDGLSDEIDPADRVTSMVGENAKTYLGSDYSSVSDFAVTDDICGTLVNYGSTWEWFNPDNFTIEPENGIYVYTATGNNKNAAVSNIPYVDFNIAANTAINITVGTLAEMGNFTFEFAPAGSDVFTVVSADNYNVVSETAASKVSYLAASGKSGKANLTISSYSVALPQNGTLRVKFPASYVDMYNTVTANYNTAVTFLCRSCAAFIVPPTAESITYGDVNGDDVIDARDIVCLKKAVAQVEGIVFDKLASNVDGVVGINSGDLIVMRDYLMGEIKNLK